MSLQRIIPLVLIVSMMLNVFTMGLRANARDAIALFRNPGRLVRALLAMNVLMPVFAVVLISVFDLSPPVRIALVALSVSPILPLLPNKMVKAGGSYAHAVGLVIPVGLLAIVFIPLAMEIIERVRGVPLQMNAASIASAVFMTALLPIAAGIAVHRFVPGWAERVATRLSQVSGILVLLCFCVAVLSVAPDMRTLVGNGTIMALVVFVLFGLAIGHLLGGPEPENRTALALATATRHPGIALALAQTNFPDQNLALAAVFLYLLVNGIVSIPYLLWDKRERPSVANAVK